MNLDDELLQDAQEDAAAVAYKNCKTSLMTTCYTTF